MSTGAFIRALFQAGVYKRTQGRVARQVTCAAIWTIFLVGAWRLWYQFTPGSPWRTIAPGMFLLVGLWLGYRVVNVPEFADFLIAVEAEMNKVSWPSRAELIRSSIIVIFVIFILAGVLFTYDMIWRSLFVLIGVRPG